MYTPYEKIEKSAKNIETPTKIDKKK